MHDRYFMIGFEPCQNMFIVLQTPLAPLFLQTRPHLFCGCSARPFSLALRKVWFNLIVAVAVFGYFAYGAYFFYPVLDTRWPSANRFRFVPILHDPAAAVNATGGFGLVYEVGLLLDGCDLAAAGGPAAYSNQTFVAGKGFELDLAMPVRPNGLWFELTPSAAVVADATGSLWMAVEQSQDAGETWASIAYPFWATRSGVSYTGVPGRTEVDLRPPWQWTVRYVMVMIEGMLEVSVCDTIWWS